MNNERQTHRSERLDDGLLVVLSSPSGGGKTTVIKRIIAENPEQFVYSVSMTTRTKRTGEVEGKDYLFVTPAEFQRHIDAGDLIEYERVHDWYYGTPKSALEAQLKDGKNILLDLDVFGAVELKRLFGNRALLIFLEPPDEKLLLERLKSRSTESAEQIERRLQRLPKEMAMASQFDAVIVNDKLEDTIKRVVELIHEKRMTLHKMEVNP